MASTWGISWGNSWLNNWDRNAVVVVVPPEPVVFVSGPPPGQNWGNARWESIEKGEFELDELDLQILREDSELITFIIAIC
jgi:hypothetical protein